MTTDPLVLQRKVGRKGRTGQWKGMVSLTIHSE